MHIATIRKLILFILLFASIGWSQEDSADEESLGFIDLLANSEMELWGCSSDESDDEGNPIPNGNILDIDESGDVSIGEPLAVKAIVTILKDYDGYAQVFFGNTVYPIPDGGKFFTNQYREDGATLIGTIVDRSENQYNLPGGTEFGPLAQIWLLDRDRGKLTIGTEEFGIEMFGCEQPPEDK